MKKILIFIAIFFIGIITVLILAKNSIAQFALTKAVKEVTGLDINVEKAGVGLLNSYVSVNGLTVFNPQGFTDRLMADVPEIYVAYDLPAILKGTAHLQKLRLDLREFIVIRDKDGVLNVNKISGLQKKSGEKAGSAGPQIKIDLLELKIGKVVYKDYMFGEPPSISEYNINIDEKYQNITDAKELVRLIVGRAVLNTAVSRLVNFDIGNLKSEFEGIINGVEGAGADTIEGTLKELESIFKLPKRE